MHDLWPEGAWFFSEAARDVEGCTRYVTSFLARVPAVAADTTYVRGVTEVSQWCHSSVTVMSQWCHRGLYHDVSQTLQTQVQSTVHSRLACYVALYHKFLKHVVILHLLLLLFILKNSPTNKTSKLKKRLQK